MACGETNPGTQRYWLITYWCESSTAKVCECVWFGTLGGWRIENLKYKDGPYVLLGAHELTKQEHDKLNGVIG